MHGARERCAIAQPQRAAEPRAHGNRRPDPGHKPGVAFRSRPASDLTRFAVAVIMPVDAKILKTLISRELGHLSDDRVKEYVRRLLVEPQPVLRNWDYGEPGEQYLCWTVLNDSVSNTGIAYCENGFGPRNPWGLVWLESEDVKQLSMGMDCGWFSTFLDAFFDSFAATRLPIWRVFRTNDAGNRDAITGEGSWEATWARIAECRQADPLSRYDCDHSITMRGQKNNE